MTPDHAEEQVRQDAADRMQHSTTSDLSARLMCRVGFRELTLMLAHYDGLKQAHSARQEGQEKPPVITDEMAERAANAFFIALRDGGLTRGGLRAALTAALETDNG